MRLVSLCPSTTETLIDFGLSESLAGVTRYCIHPAEVVPRLPKVGGTKNPDLEAIVAARPDLVLMNAEENRIEDHQALIERGLRVDVTCPKTIQEIPALLRHFGALTERSSIAEERAMKLEAALDALSPAGRYRFAYLIWRRPWMSVNGETYISDLFRRTGGENTFSARPERYPEITLAELTEGDPDLLLLPDEPYPFEDRHREEIRSALPRARIELVSGDDCCWHGVRSIRGLALAARLAGELCGRDRHE